MMVCAAESLSLSSHKNVIKIMKSYRMGPAHIPEDQFSPGLNDSCSWCYEQCSDDPCSKEGL